MPTNTKIRIVFFDCDGVLLFGNPWEKLVKAVGLPKEVDQKWLNDYYANKITFDEWTENIRRFYVKAGLDRKIVTEAFGPRGTSINPQAQEVLNYLNSKRIETAIISSGAKDYVSRVAKHFGIKYYFYNTTFVFDKNDKFIEIKTFGEDPNVKVSNIQEVCKKLNINPQNSVFVGDSSNDYKAFEYTKHGIMYGNHPKLENIAWKKINNLKEIINIIEEENGRV